MRPYIFLLTLAIAVPVKGIASSDETVDFATRIAPLFVEHCCKCHGATKKMGQLRLTSVDTIREKLSAEPELLVAGNPDDSELFQRLVLPKDHKKRMPKQAVPLSAETIALIRKWIEQGAVLSNSVAEEKPNDALPQETTNEKPLPEVEPAATEAIERLAASGAQTMPLYGGSPLLEVSYALRSEPASDTDLRLLDGVAEQLISLNLKGGRVSDKGYVSLAKFRNLRTLHLELSSIHDDALAFVADLADLEYLNLYGTDISDAGLRHLKGLEFLRHLYLWQTPVSYEAAMELVDQNPRIDVDFGHDHPAVVQKRLTAQIEDVTRQIVEAKAEEQKTQLQLDSARQNRESLESRLAEIRKSLQELTDPPSKSSEAAAPSRKNPPAVSSEQPSETDHE